MDPIIFPLLLAGSYLFLNKPAPAAVGKYIPEPQPAMKSKLSSLLTKIEKQTQIYGLKQFLMGVAYVESKFIPSAIRYEKFSPETISKIKSKFKTNKYIHNFKYWTLTGGLYQLFPSTALSVDGDLAINNNPLTVFDPYYSTAYAIDFSSRLNKYYEAHRWLDVRLGWSSLYNLINKPPEKTLAIEGRIVNGIEKTGGDPEILYDYLPYNFNHYRKNIGFNNLLQYIMSIK